MIAPEGAAGGRSARTGELLINPETDDQKRLPSRYADYPLKTDDVFRLDTPGGGGYGDPLERDPEKVLADVREGYVSPDHAARDYGVAIVREAGHWIIDHIETAKLRKEHETRKT